MPIHCFRAMNFSLSVVVLIFLLPSPGRAQNKAPLEKRILRLEHRIDSMANEQRTLTARIAVLEQLSLFTSVTMLRQGYISATQNSIISAMMNLTSNAYSFRIRPASMGGGGGSFATYNIPKLLRSNDYATFTASVFPDSIIFIGTAKNGLGSAQCTLNGEGKIGGWVYTGDFE